MSLNGSPPNAAPCIISIMCLGIVFLWTVRALSCARCPICPLGYRPGPSGSALSYSPAHKGRGGFAGELAEHCAAGQAAAERIIQEEEPAGQLAAGEETV